LGLYLEDFEINVPQRTRGRTIGEGDVRRLPVWWRSQSAACRRRVLQEHHVCGRVAHGPLAPTAIGLMSQLNWIDGTAMACSAWRGLHGPVKLGDTISAKVTPLGRDRRKARPRRAQARLRGGQSA
jgi:hypothetical protein